MKWARLSSVLLFAAALACGATGGQFLKGESVPTGMAGVYIYRPWDFFQGGTWPNVTIDGLQPHPLRNGGYLYYALTPGTHKVKIWKRGIGSVWAQNKSDYPIQVEANSVNYYRLSLHIVAHEPILYRVLILLSKVPEDVAIPELKQTKLST